MNAQTGNPFRNNCHRSLSETHTHAARALSEKSERVYEQTAHTAPRERGKGDQPALTHRSILRAVGGVGAEETEHTVAPLSVLLLAAAVLN
jgi:hypothetical protein